MTAQAIGSTFALLEATPDTWTEVRGSVAVPMVGTREADGAEPRDLEVARMIRAFRLGLKDLLSLWEQVMEPATLDELIALAAAPDDAFRFPHGLWARVVYDFALGYRFLAAAAHVADGPAGIGPEVAATMHRLFQMNFAGLVSVGLAVWIGATGIAAIRTDLLPHWLGWASVAIAAGLMTPLHGPLEGIALVWIVMASVLLYRRTSLDEHVQAESARQFEPRAGMIR